MAKTIDLETRNLLPVAEAKRRIELAFDQLRAAYLDVIGDAEMSWEGDTAHVLVRVLKHEVTARIDVTPSDLKLQIQLPWLLAAVAPMIESIIIRQATASLPIAGEERKPREPGATN